MAKGIKEFIKKETVLLVAALCAVVTMFLVPPDGEYIAYIDLRVLCLLLSLMAVVAGFQACGAFKWLTYRLLSGGVGGRALGLILVMLPFFSSMLVTNDVALLVFVPFTVLLLMQTGCTGAIIPILVLQTVAANLGSMATPVGNPQNLFIYAAYELGAGEFFGVTLPLAAISLVCVAAASLPILPKKLPDMNIEKAEITSNAKLGIYALLFVLCLLTVFRVVHFGICTAVVIIAVALLDRKILRELDYALLATFVCFFIVSGNLGRIDAVRNFLGGLLGKNAVLTAIGTSQIISNVPAAVLLSAFTDNWKALLQGVNIGGLGTPIASLASLITLKLYMREKGARAGRFILVFLAANIIGLAILYLASLVL